MGGEDPISKWVSRCVPQRLISPLPKTSIRRKAPLKKVDPGTANLTYSRRVVEKRSRSAPANSTPSKKQRQDQTEEVDPVNDPMDIFLEQSCDFLLAPFDKEYEHVKFSAPTKIFPIDLDQNSDDKIDEHERASNILLGIYDRMPDHRDSEKKAEVEEKKKSEKRKLQYSEKKIIKVTEENKKSENGKVKDSEKKIEKSNWRE